MLSPIIVFAYNRPAHLQQTLDALCKNLEASESTLYIYCDGPKADATEKNLASIRETRFVAHSASGFKEIHIIEADRNKGLAKSIISGVSEILQEYGRVIVLEDDLLTSPFFLHYMNSALDFYDKRKSVFSISANRPPVRKMSIPDDYPYDVFVSLRSFSTGWATWIDRWEQVDWTMSYLDDFLSHYEQINAFNRGGDDMTEMLQLQRDGKIDSWAIQFSFAHFFHHAIAILPCVPYVDNIGFDGSGVHSGKESKGLYRNNLDSTPEMPRFLDVLYEDRRIIDAFYNSYVRKRRPIWQKAINWVFRRMSMKPPFVIKGRVFA